MLSSEAMRWRPAAASQDDLRVVLRDRGSGCGRTRAKPSDEQRGRRKQRERARDGRRGSRSSSGCASPAGQQRDHQIGRDVVAVPDEEVAARAVERHRGEVAGHGEQRQEPRPLPPPRERRARAPRGRSDPGRLRQRGSGRSRAGSIPRSAGALEAARAPEVLRAGRPRRSFPARPRVAPVEQRVRARAQRQVEVRQRARRRAAPAHARSRSGRRRSAGSRRDREDREREAEDRHVEVVRRAEAAEKRRRDEIASAPAAPPAQARRASPSATKSAFSA